MPPTYAAALAALLLATWPAVAGADPVTKKLAVKGAVTVAVAVKSGDLEVRAGGKGEVTVTADVEPDDPSSKLAIASKGDQISIQTGPGIDGVIVTVPVGTRLSLASISGDVKVGAVGGGVKVRATSGDVSLDGPADVDLVTVSGDVRITGARGAVRLRTVSGDSAVATAGSAPVLDFETTSGELEWAGVCGKGCALNLKSLSGDLDLKLGKASSFALELESFSGELADHLGLTIDKQVGGGEDDVGAGASTEAHYGKREGTIRASIFSGDLDLAKP